MTLLADYLRDNTGKTFRIAPNSDGELVITDEDIWVDTWSSSSYTIRAWTDPTYVLGTLYAGYQTLADSAGTAWYVYITNAEGYPELVITDTAPAANTGVWVHPTYGGVKMTPTEATTGDEVYLPLADSDGTSWYVYPNAEGELIIATTEPA